MDIQQAVARFLDDENLDSRDLSTNEMREVMMQIMTGNATDAQIGAFLVGLRIKGETVEEITGAAQVMPRRALLWRLQLAPVWPNMATVP